MKRLCTNCKGEHEYIISETSSSYVYCEDCGNMKEIALKQSKDGKFKEIELKHKKGILVYDVELSEGLMDREFIIDANTGEILRNKKDF